MTASKSDDKTAAIGLATDSIAYIDGNPRVVGRLPAGLRDQLVADKALLQGTGTAPSTSVARHAHETATSTEESARATALGYVRRLREAVTDAGLPADEQRAWGIGIKISEGVNRTILDAGAALRSRASDPAKAALVGIAPVDVTRLTSALDALRAADSEQGGARGVSTKATSDEDAAIARIFSGAARVGSAGNLEYGHDDTSGPADTHPDPQRAAAARGLRDRAVPPTTKAASAKRAAKAEAAKAKAADAAAKSSDGAAAAAKS